MGMSYLNVKMSNLLIGAVCFGLGIYSYTHSSPSMVTDVDRCGMVLTVLAVVEAILGGLFCTKLGDCCFYFCYKCCCCFASAITGTALLLEALAFWQEKHPSCFSHSNPHSGHKRDCQFMELRIAVGVLLIFNGVLYLFAKPEPRHPPVLGGNAILRPTHVVVSPRYQATRPAIRPDLQGGGRRTTVITTNGGSTSIVNILNTSVTQPLISTTTPIAPASIRSAPFPSATANNPHQPQGFTQRPLPPLPGELSTGARMSSPFVPSAPPPAYFDCPPPPYSTLPQNAQLRK